MLGLMRNNKNKILSKAGRKGAHARVLKTTPAQRSEISSKAAKAMWAKRREKERALKKTTA